MATAAQAKRIVLFSGAVTTGLTALEYSTTKGGVVPIRVVVGGLLASAVLLALSDAQPDMAYGLALLALLASILVPGPTGKSRVDLFRRIGGRI